MEYCFVFFVSEHAYNKLFQNMFSPSTFDEKGWWDTAALGMNEECVIQHHRFPAFPAGRTHVSLLHAVFGDFLYTYQNEVARTNEDNEFLANFCKEMARRHHDKNSRLKSGNRLLETYLKQSIKCCEVGSYYTDGTIMWSLAADAFITAKPSAPEMNFEKMVLVNIEYKNEIGGRSGDPTMRNIGYFIHWLKECRLQQAYNLRLPCFLVSIAGPLIAIYGVVAYGGTIHCDPLTPYLHALPIIDDIYSWRKLGSAMRALKLSIPKLHQYYSDLRMRKDIVPIYQNHPYPYLDQILVDNNQAIKLVYDNRLARRVFLARIPTTGRKVVVKFIQSVLDVDSLIRGQRALASIGSAPELVGYTQIPPNWTVTVSEFIADAEWYESTPERDTNLVAALQCLHELEIVHGDIRHNNVLVLPNSSRVFLVDFDFSGLHGVARYPDRLNHAEIRWPAGATDGSFLRVEHDREWANCMMRYQCLSMS